ncbi:MAG: GNAT family N-acetyltransferase [Candidatus Hermodarchaeota archaeon]
MIEISTHRLKQISIEDLSEIAQLTLVAREASALKEGDIALIGIELTVKGIKEFLQKYQASSSPFGVITVRSNGTLIGWLMISLDPDMPSLSPYHPVISPNNITKDLATQLIKQALDYARKEGLKKVQAFLEIAEHLEQLNNIYRSWYEAENLTLRGESYSMLLSLSEYQPESIKLPENFLAKPILDVDKDELYQCYVETFKTSLDRWNLDLTDEERQKQFNNSVQPSSSSLNKDASLGLLHNKKIVGFSIVENVSPEVGYLLDFGIHPDFRGRKIGKSLLRLTINNLAKQGLKTVTLHSDSQNDPAVILYRDVGFKITNNTMRYQIRFR